jgi:hypothetical protein
MWAFPAIIDLLLRGFGGGLEQVFDGECGGIGK